MRIQHNIMAMNAYRNYNNNTKGLSGNLEKLSSGYKINRAGDDAAGLAISEKMRAQITGLNAAQKNVKDGISLVKTAEGAMQEVQDMLNRMDYLATQSANGTYDNQVDRANLQKEVVALKEEINRIADSANFNGIKLLDGSIEKAGATTTTINGSERILSEVIKDGEKAWNVEGNKTILDTAAAQATTGAFKVDLTTLSFTGISTTPGTSAQGFTLTIGTKSWTATAAVAAKSTMTSASIMKAVASKIAAKIGATATFNGCKWTVANANGVLTFTQKAKPATASQAQYDWDVKVSYTAPGSNATKGYVMDASHLEGTVVTKQGAAAVGANMANTVFNITAADIKDGTVIKVGNSSVTLAVGANSQIQTGTGVVNLKDMEEGKVDLKTALSRISVAMGGSATVNCKDVTGADATCNFLVGVNDGSNGQPTGITVQRQTAIAAFGAPAGIGAYFNTKDKLAGIFSITQQKAATKGLTLQIGDTSDPFNQMSVSVKDMHTSAMGITSVDISTQDGASKAVQTVKDAINYVSSIRGDLGAVQNRLEHTQNNLSVMAENIQDAESTIRDTDVAEEMMSYVKNNILVQSAQAMLAQANQVPQGVLQLLG